jgi:flagellar hook-associated protein 2
MPSITSTGVGSGLDVNAIVTQLMAIEARPLTLLQQDKTNLNTQLSAFGTLQSLTSAMRDAANKVASVSLWQQTVATSSDTGSVTVSTAGGAATGAYSVAVQSLASMQTVSSRAFASSSETLGEGTLTIELGSWAGEPAPTGFTAKSGSTPVSISIGPGETSLASIRDKINAAGAGVTASIVNDASGARLALRSSATGAENAFRISASETVDDGNAASGLSALAFDAAGGASQMTRNQSAGDARATVNGIAVTSASNTLDGVADGMTLTLLKTTSSDVSVNVGADGASVKTAITSFVKAFNDLAANIRDQTKYDPQSKVAGTLQGDRVVGSVLSQLRGVINQPSSASSVYSQLSDLGITMQSDGTLAVDGTKLDAAIANRAELRKVLATDGATSGVSGFMDRFRDLGNALLGTDGSLQTRTASLQSMMSRNDKSQSAMQDRLTQTEARLRAQYQALDTNMAKLNGLQNYLTGQLAALSKA